MYDYCHRLNKGTKYFIKIDKNETNQQKKLIFGVKITKNNIKYSEFMFLTNFNEYLCDIDELYQLLCGNIKFNKIINDVYRSYGRKNLDILINTLENCNIKEPLFSLIYD